LSLAAAALGVALAAAPAGEAEKEPREKCPLKWHLSLEKGLAEAAAKGRPVVLVFSQGGTLSHDWFAGSRKNAEGKRYWTAVEQVRQADVVLVKMPPPPKLKLTTGAPAQQVRMLQQAHKKLLDRYNKTARRYGVYRLPTVLFLSPDGDTVFKTFTRKTESTVVGALRHLPHYLHHWREARALGQKKDPSKLDSSVRWGSSGTRGKWYASMAGGIAAAKKRDRPMVLVFTESKSTSTDWFGYSESKTDGSLEWPAAEQLKTADVVVVKIAPPSGLKMRSGADYKEVSKLRSATAKQMDAYGKLARKYGVTRIPAVRFLSPDGEMVLKSYNRVPESMVLKGLKLLPKLFADYKQMRAMLKAAGDDEDEKPKPPPAKKPPGGDF
jgi:hypothetical protein